MIATPRAESSTAFLDTIQKAIDRARQSSGGSIVCSVTAIEPIDLALNFAAARDLRFDCGYWERPDQRHAILGVGSAVAIEADSDARFDSIDRQWRNIRESLVIERDAHSPASVGPILLGGFAFTNRAPQTEIWEHFPSARFVLPRTTIVRHGDQFWRIRCDRVTDRDNASAVAAAFDRDDRRIKDSVERRGQIQADMSDPVDVREVSAWERLVTRGTDAIEDGLFEKVVIARSVRVQSDRIDLGKAIEFLSENYQGCTIFAIGRAESCFLGATPERLVQLSDKNVAVSCIAGTAARGGTEAEDVQLGAELLASDKNRREHSYVVETIMSSLAGHCDDLRVPEAPELLRVRNLQHLYTPLTATIRPDRSLFDLVADLHPTPAVGGTPREPALAFIDRYENLDRGWYAAPVGWVDEAGNGEFVVALRSAIINQNDNAAVAHLYAGCGVVAGSEPEAELRESRLKLRPMLSALSGRNA